MLRSAVVRPWQEIKKILAASQVRFNFCKGEESLNDVIAAKIPKHQKKIKEFAVEHAKTVVGEIQVAQIYGGMRGMLGLICETSSVDPEKGIRFRNLTIPDLQKKLPKAEGGEEPLPEGVFWLLLTGDVPTKEQVRKLSKDWAKRAELPEYIIKMLKNMPKCVHPMSQFSSAVTALNLESKFAKAYSSGVHKTKLWESCLEDSMNLIARLPVIAAHIYINSYRDGKGDICVDPDLDWSANFCKNMGYKDPDFTELMRLYLTIHCDHEGGNVSAHATHLVGSALSDPYLSFAAGMNGLAGPLHGLANQEVLIWIQAMQKELGDEPTEEKIKEFALKTLKSGKVIPGYGHAVLRQTDPRYTCQSEFAKKHMPKDPLVSIVAKLLKVIPPILTSLGKVKNPWPNVDAHSGVLLQYYGMKEMNFYTVLFGVSRALGVLSSLVWDRALGLPIERPKSATTDQMIKIAEKAACKAKEKAKAKESTCKKEEPKESPCKKEKPKESPCKKEKPKESPCKKEKPKESPCKKEKPKESPCKKEKPNPCKKEKPNPCKKEKPDPCKKPKPKPNPCSKPKPKPNPCSKPKPKPNPCSKPKPKPNPCKKEKPNPCKKEKPNPCKKPKPKPNPCGKPKPKPNPCKKQKPKPNPCKKEKPKPNPCKKEKPKPKKDPCKKKPKEPGCIRDDD